MKVFCVYPSCRTPANFHHVFVLSAHVFALTKVPQSTRLTFQVCVSSVRFRFGEGSKCAAGSCSWSCFGAWTWSCSVAHKFNSMKVKIKNYGVAFLLSLLLWKPSTMVLFHSIHGALGKFKSRQWNPRSPSVSPLLTMTLFCSSCICP